MAVGFVAAGASAAGTTSLSVAWPGSQSAGDIGLLLIETFNGATVAASGWTELSSSPVESSSFAHALHVLYKIAAGSDSSVSVSGLLNHAIARILVFSGVDGTTPINATAQQAAEIGTSITLPSVTTDVADCAIVHVAGTGRDTTATTTFSAWTNANLASITEVADDTTGTAGGGGFGAAWGILAAAGASGTGACTQAVSIVWTAITVALKPAAGGSASQTNTASGSITFNGDASTAIGITATTFGFLTFNDGAGIQVGRAFLTDGFLAFDGAASEEHSGTQSQTNNAAGSLSLSGDAALSSGLVLTTAGSLAFTQGANISYGVVNVPTGSLLFSGAAGMSSGGPSILGSDFNWRSRGYGR